jgi:hypothetical protein
VRADAVPVAAQASLRRGDGVGIHFVEQKKTLASCPGYKWRSKEKQQDDAYKVHPHANDIKIRHSRAHRVRSRKPLNGEHARWA